MVIYFASSMREGGVTETPGLANVGTLYRGLLKQFLRDRRELEKWATTRREAVVKRHPRLKVKKLLPWRWMRARMRSLFRDPDLFGRTEKTARATLLRLQEQEAGTLAALEEWHRANEHRINEWFLLPKAIAGVVVLVGVVGTVLRIVNYTVDVGSFTDWTTGWRHWVLLTAWGLFSGWIIVEGLGHLARRRAIRAFGALLAVARAHKKG